MPVKVNMKKVVTTDEVHRSKSNSPTNEPVINISLGKEQAAGYINDYMTFAENNPETYKSLKNIYKGDLLGHMSCIRGTCILCKENSVEIMEAIRSDARYWKKDWLCRECYHLMPAPGLFNGGRYCRLDHDEKAVTNNCPQFEQMSDERIYKEIRRSAKLLSSYYISPTQMEKPKNYPHIKRFYGRGQIKCGNCTRGEHIIDPKFRWPKLTNCPITGKKMISYESHFCKNFDRQGKSCEYGYY